MPQLSILSSRPGEAELRQSYRLFPLMPKPSKTIATEALRHGEAAQAGTCEAESIVNRLRRRR
jgi:hypothetical protein